MRNKERFTEYLMEFPNYMSFFAVPIYLFTAGPMLIEMSESLSIVLGDLNLIFTFFTVGIVIGHLTSVLYNKKISSTLVIILFYILIILVLIPLLFNKNLYVFYLIYFIMGYASGVIFVQTTKCVLECHISNKERLTTILMFFYPIGCITAPFIASTLINNNLNWRFSYYVMILVSIINIILYISLKLRRGGGSKLKEEAIPPFKKIFNDKRINIIFIVGCIIGFFYCGSETVMTAWLPTFLRSVRSMDIFFAGFSVSLFWIGILTGRIIVSILAGKFKSNYIMLILSVISFGTLAPFLFSGSHYLLLVFAAVSGLFFSGLGPLQTVVAGTLYEKGRGVLISIIFATQFMGTSLAPVLTKVISNRNISFSIVIAPAFMLMVIVSILVKIFLDKRLESIRKSLNHI
jgi:FHS family glucose/mannose:H+ symporter-like MFS transporter